MIKREEIKKEDIIGEREFQQGRLEYACLAVTAVFILLAALCFASSDSYEYFDSSMMGLGIFCLIFGMFFAVIGFILIKERRQNNGNPNPAIAIREDGVFVLYHANGRKESLTDKIIDVINLRKIVFTLEKPGGIRYTRSVKHVHSQGMVVIRIKNILSYNDGKHTYSNYEKARLFCAYCGSKVDVKSGKCSSCGGKPAL